MTETRIPELIREASDWQINDAFRVLGNLYGAEHAEADDDGVAQVEALFQGLRKFKQHEDEEGYDADGCGCSPCCC